MIALIVVFLVGVWLGLWVACLLASGEIDALHRRVADLDAMSRRAAPPAAPRFRSLDAIVAEQLIEDTRLVR